MWEPKRKTPPLYEAVSVGYRKIQTTTDVAVIWGVFQIIDCQDAVPSHEIELGFLKPLWTRDLTDEVQRGGSDASFPFTADREVLFGLTEHHDQMLVIGGPVMPAGDAEHFGFHERPPSKNSLAFS